MPERVRMRRVKGWRLPAGCAYVGRPTRFGNPFHQAEIGRAEAVRRFALWLEGRLEAPPGTRPDARQRLLADLPALRGLDLACWCPLDGPCHADVLLDRANRPVGRSPDATD